MNLRLHPPHRDGDLLPPGFDTEAIIKEARRLRRRRWMIGMTAALIAALVAVVATGVSAGSRGSSTERPTIGSGGRPYVNAKALAGEGTLAFISQGRLWVLDGSEQSLRRVPVTTGSVPLSPSISADGKWLAYLVGPASESSPTTTLWMARADGTDAHQVSTLPVDSTFGWSPTSDWFGVVTDTTFPYGSGNAPLRPTAVELFSPAGRHHQLVAATPAAPRMIEDAVWSPDGRSVAVSSWALANGPATIDSYPVGGGSPTNWFSISPTASLPGVCSGCGGGETIADLAGWWPNWGVGFWVYTSGATHNNDQTPLEALTGPQATPRIIAWTLSDGITDAVSASRGDLAVVEVTASAGRSYGQGKVVETCQRSTLTCSPIPGDSVWTGPDHQRCPTAENFPCGPLAAPGIPGSAVSLDPAWSPTGDTLAYVKSPESPSPGWPSTSWYQAHQLFIWNPVTRTSTKIAEISGISVPTWSADGTHLLYVSNDELWLWKLHTKKPVEIASPLYPPSQWENLTNFSVSYYGQINWTGQFNWWSPAPTPPTGPT